MSSNRNCVTRVSTERYCGTETEGVDWINLAQDGDQWRALRDPVMNYFNAVRSVVVT